MRLEKLPSTENAAAQLLKVTAESLATPHSLFGKLKCINNPPLNSVERAIKKAVRKGERDIPTSDGKFIVSIRGVGSTGRYHVTVADREGHDIMSTRVDVSAERKVYTRDVRARLGLHKTGKSLGSDKRSDLPRADLQKRNLSGMSLAMCNLKWAKLQDCDLRGADLRYSDLRFAELSRADLRDADLRGTRLRAAELSGVNLSGADLRGRDLRSVYLRGANLSGASLTGANLFGVNLGKVDLTGAILHLVPEGIQWSHRELDIQLNHYNNQRGSLLSTLNSIDDRFADIKIAQARILMNSLSCQGFLPARLASIALPLLDVLGRQPYISDPVLAAWGADVAEARIEQHGTGDMSDEMADICLRVFESTPDRMLKQNAVFHKVIDLALKARNPAIIRHAEKAYSAWLALPEVVPYTRFNLDRPDASAQVSLQNTDEVNLVLWPATAGGPVMLLSRDTYQNMQKPDPQNPVWDHFFLMNTPDSCVPTTEVVPEALFRKDFPQFLGPFLSEQRKNGFDRLLDMLNLGHYRENFVSATKARSSGTKMVGAKEQTDLDALFSHTLQPGKSWGGLTEDHTQEIVQAYGLGDVTKREQAQYFLCLSAMFARFSSSHFFGTEGESPVTLRAYAHALMLKSRELDSSVTDGQFTGWQNQFQKRAGAFDCTAILSSDMTAHIHYTCPQVMTAIRPAAWA